MRQFIIAVLILFSVSILINGCASINKEDAETKAINFVKQTVGFFAKEGDSTKNLQEYRINNVRSYQEDKNWVVIMQVSSELDNETKKNDLTIKLNNKGDVIEFNGRKVPKQLR